MPGVPVSRPSEPAYAGAGATFAKLPLVLDPNDLTGVDVAIVGAPTDDAVSYRPGARFGPRAIRLADVGGGPHRPNMDLGVNPFDVLTVVDYGDAEVVLAFDEQRDRSVLDRARRVVMAVGDAAHDAREAGAGRDATAVVLERVHVDGGVAANVEHVDVGQELLELHARGPLVKHREALRVSGRSRRATWGSRRGHVRR